MMTDFFFILENDPNYPIEKESNRQTEPNLTFSGPLLHTNRVPDSNGVSKFLIPFFFTSDGQINSRRASSDHSIPWYPILMKGIMQHASLSWASLHTAQIMSAIFC